MTPQIPLPEVDPIQSFIDGIWKAGFIFLFSSTAIISIIFVCSVCCIICIHRRCCTNYVDDAKDFLDFAKKNEPIIQQIGELKQARVQHTNVLEEIRHDLKVLTDNNQRIVERLDNLESSLPSKRDSIAYQSIVLEERKQEHSHDE